MPFHYGQAHAMRAAKQATLDAAFQATPNRFKGINPCLAPMPTAVWINPPSQEVQTNTQHCTVNPDWDLAAQPEPDYEVDPEAHQLVTVQNGDSDALRAGLRAPLGASPLATQSAANHRAIFINQAVFDPLSHSQPVPYLALCG